MALPECVRASPGVCEKSESLPQLGSRGIKTTGKPQRRFVLHWALVSLKRTSFSQFLLRSLPFPPKAYRQLTCLCISTLSPYDIS